MQKQTTFWDRETILMMGSISMASFMWIIADMKLLIVILIGLVTYVFAAVAYESLAYRFGWQHLEIAITFRDSILPRLLRLISRTQNA